MLDEEQQQDGDGCATITTAAAVTVTGKDQGVGVAGNVSGGDRLESIKKQFISLVCSFTNSDELNAFSHFAAHVLYQQRAVLAKSPSTYYDPSHLSRQLREATPPAAWG
jgi:hypothetical protein